MSDYISREAAIEAVREMFSCETCNGSNIGTICTFCDVGQAILLIKNIPSADVAEVRHGRWESVRNPTWKTQYHDKCPICGWENTRNAKCYDGDNRTWRSLNSCPNCGSKMDLEEK